ncbi:GSCOCG00011542001-RA-CDS, partial [Cotesia congregata]
SVLCDIPKFDIIKNLTPDWMHCVALGVCRQFLKLWIDSSYHEREFYLGNHISATDKLLLSFKPSMDVSRTPRTMSKDRLHLKAHELVIWLLMYSLPILKLCLPNKFVTHWSLLVEGISILLKTSITEVDVYCAQRNLFQFVKETEELYGKEHISFNLHLLTHLPESVLDWGPLWTHSAFCFENFHQFLKKLVKSSNQADQQI